MENTRLFDRNAVAEDLRRAGALLAAYELLKYSLIESIRGFFSAPWMEKGRFHTELRLGASSQLENASRWFKTMGALNEEDCTSVSRIEKMRNRVAHELPRLLVEERVPDMAAELTAINALIQKVERWWVEHIEASIDPDAFREVNFDEPGAVDTGLSMLSRYLLEITLGTTGGTGDA